MHNRVLFIIILKIDLFENFIQSYGAYTADIIFKQYTMLFKFSYAAWIKP